MNLKKVLFISLPLLGGIGVAQLFLKSTSSSSLRPYEQEIPTGQHQNQLASTTLLPNQLVSQYLLSSQALLSQAIESSLQNKDSSKNEQVVKLINEAITQATQATIAAPQDARGYAQRGKIYKTIEKYLDNAPEAALKDYLHATRLDPYQLSYYEQIGVLYLKLDKSQQALENWQKAAYLNPTEAKVWHQLAKIQTSLGYLTQAKTNYQRILSLVLDGEQKEEIEKEITALNNLLSQTNQAPSSKNKGQEDLILPNQPPQLEAKITAQVILADPQEKSESQDSALESNALSGTASLGPNEQVTEIQNTNINTNSEIYLAELNNPNNQILRVASKQEGSFKVEVPKSSEQEITFRYWIIN